MKLGRWTKPCTFPAKSRDGFGESTKKWVTEPENPLFFCDVNHAPLCHFPWIDFRQTFHKHVSRCSDTWFHIPEKFPLRGQISRKTVFFRVQKGTVCGEATVHGKRSAMPKLFPSPRGHPTDLSFLGNFCWGMYRFPAIYTSEQVRTSCDATA